MAAEFIKRTDGEVEIKFTMKLTGSMLADEQTLLENLNKAGRLAMEPIIEQFDTKGEPIRVGNIKHTAKDRTPQTYETPYGCVTVTRHVYQTSKGGCCYVPLEAGARMMLNSTPRYSKMISGKYSQLGADAIREDLLECNGRKISRNYAKKLSDYVGTIAQYYDAEWTYDLPEFEKPAASVSIGLDGTCMLMRKDGWREAMCGSIAFYDNSGERLHTIYSSATPEYGKEKFKKKFAREIELVQKEHPCLLYIGLADGAKDNWPFLKEYTSKQLLDFYHAREYISKAATALFGKKESKEKTEWTRDWSSRLKHKQGAASRFIKELETQQITRKFGSNAVERKEKIRQVITYYINNKSRMSYSSHVAENLPIGSGVTEAACKVLIKQRMCRSGSRWKDHGASSVLSLRALKLTTGRWDQFWNYIMRHGSTES